ncbi:Metallo-hydrolase/oxidoreductase [Trametopsis cervina]|nr:Metallo-hydrolase/oxidoreductase [Trametopsis cervina]
MSLPRDSADQAFVGVKAMLTCFIHLPYNLVFADTMHYPDNSGSYVPVFNFLITHPTRGLALFDLGVRKYANGYPPDIPRVVASRAGETAYKDVADHLREEDIRPEDVKTVIISHMHWDHIGDPALFTSAELVLGAGARAALAEDVYPANPHGTIQRFPKNQKVTFIDFTNSSSNAQAVLTPFASFSHAIDFYGDGSLYLVDAPGHYRGHIAALARIAPNTFVFLGGDTCHNRQCYVPGTRITSNRIHYDGERAKETINRLAKLNEEADNVVVILAHEAERLEEGMPLFPHDIKDWVTHRIEKRVAAKTSRQV